MSSPADKSVCLTKYLTKSPKFSALDLTNYLHKHMEKKKLKTENMSSIIVLLLPQISVSVFLCLSGVDADRLILTFQA